MGGLADVGRGDRLNSRGQLGQILDGQQLMGGLGGVGQIGLGGFQVQVDVLFHALERTSSQVDQGSLGFFEGVEHLLRGHLVGHDVGPLKKWVSMDPTIMTRCNKYKCPAD